MIRYWGIWASDLYTEMLHGWGHYVGCVTLRAVTDVSTSCESKANPITGLETP